MKKVNLKFLIGFPIGVMMLFLSYIMVYYLDGESEYLAEFTRLQDINVLINQVVVSGLCYTVFAIRNTRNIKTI
jgi:predicted nucleic acid-binding protein